ncbi:MAG: spermidine synthase [Myxococcota bacterium]|jgi:spermidine synthase
MKDRSFLVVALCFFLSGFAALMYETAWTREFSFVFGTSELAVATVLAAYMAGLAGGAAVGGRIAHNTRRPLALYGFLELGVGVAALLVPVALWGATQLLILLFGNQSEFGATNPLAISAFYLAVTFLIVMVPTSFMGATLPLLSRHVVTNDDEVGSRIGALYSINTIGAVAGTLTAAFVLLPSLGIRETVYVAVAINGLVFLIAIYLVRIAGTEKSHDAQGESAATSLSTGESATESVTNRASENTGLHFILPLILVSGALSFIYEVMWVRLLSQLLGGSMYAFATMLASFLLGIALGSAVASRIATSAERALRAFIWAEVGIACLSAVAFRVIDYAPEVARIFDTENQLLLDASTAMLVLLPSALCIGATFPLAVRILARGAEDAGPSSARVYSWNTVGAIIGSISAAFVLLPELGFRGTVQLGVLSNLAIAAAALFFSKQSRALLIVPAVLAGLTLMLLPGEPWNILRSSPLDRKAPPIAGKAEYFKVGRSATVLLTQNTPSRWRMSTNGLPESMIMSPNEPPTKLKTAVMLGAIGPMLRPDARSMLVVGLGGGVSVESIPHTIEQVDVIELEDEVLEANRWLSDHRAIDPLADPRVSVHINDARSALFLSEKKFDVISAQASHPWTGGAAHLYTDEFFELVSQRLNERGVFVQWVGRGFVDVDLIKSIVGTLYRHFEYVHVYREILFVSSNSPIPPVIDFEALLAKDPSFSQRTGFYTQEDFATYLLMDATSSSEFATGAEVTSDNRNLLQMRAPLIKRSESKLQKAGQRGIKDAYAAHDPLPRLTAEGHFDGIRLAQKLSSINKTARSRTLAKSLPNAADREAIRVMRAGNSLGRLGLEKYLLGNPGDTRVRANLLRLDLSVSNTGVPATPRFLPHLLNPSEAAIVDATVAFRQGDLQATASHDEALANVHPTDPLYLDAVYLRLNWRQGTKDPTAATDSIEIADEAYQATGAKRLLIFRAKAAQILGNPIMAIASLARLEIPKGSKNAKQIKMQVRKMLMAMDLEGPAARWRSELLRGPFWIEGNKKRSKQVAG